MPLSRNTSKGRKIEDETAGISPENLMETTTRGERARSGKDERRELSKDFERVSYTAGCLQSNMVRENSLINSQEVEWRKVFYLILLSALS